MNYEGEEHNDFRPGRVSMEEERLARAFFRLRKQRAQHGSVSRRASLIRWHNYQNPGATIGKREAVVKSVSNFKTASATKSCLDYISRKRSDEQKPQLYDQFGAQVGESLIDRWELASQENEGPNRRSFVQAWHLVCSIQHDEKFKDEVILIKLQNAVASFVRDEFARQYFHVIWCLHDDTPSHPHAHLIIKAKPDEGNRLHFDRTGDRFDILRDGFAAALRRQGLDYVATRRADRERLRKDIFTETESFKPRYINKHTTSAVVPDDFWPGEAPRSLGQLISSVKLPLAPKCFGDTYKQPDHAFANWLWLVKWGKGVRASRRKRYKYGLWMLVNHPEAFGELLEQSSGFTASQLSNQFDGIKLLDQPRGWKPQKKVHHRRKAADDLKCFSSIGRMMTYAISDPEEREEKLDQEFRRLIFDRKLGKRARKVEQGPAKSTRRKKLVRSLFGR